MRQTIDDFSELRVGMPIIYFDEGVERTARIEAIGWDWAVCRYTIAEEDYIGCIVDLSIVQYEVENDESILPAQKPLPLELQDRLKLLKQTKIPTFTVKGIGEL